MKDQKVTDPGREPRNKGFRVEKDPTLVKPYKPSTFKQHKRICLFPELGALDELQASDVCGVQDNL